jgi:polysaccharide deacetylase family protein (PEP-CTERM system associated)
VRATFFALGRVCERFPALLPAITDAGHEVASHGYGHELVHRQSPDAFAADVARSIEVIEQQTDRRPIGYRAPAFSMTRQTGWAGPILAGLGFRYSSSIFPIRGRRYGQPDAPRVPYRWPSCDLIEFPLTTIRMFGRNLPVCGGGYTRLLPAPILASTIGLLNRRGQPAVIYLHPYELAAEEVSSFCRRGIRASHKRKLTQSLWRSRVQGRLCRLFEEFPFSTMTQALADYTAGEAMPETLERSEATAVARTA